MSLQESEDVRMIHVQISAQQALDFDTSVWEEMIKREKNQSAIKDFLDSPTIPLLLVYFDINEELSLSIDMVNKNLPLPKRLCYFSKNNKIVSAENYKQDIVFGNLCDFPLNQYQDLFEKVIIPIFCNPLNNKRWPSVIGCDIVNHFQDFQTRLSYLVGLAEQKTVLMIPEAAKLIENVNVEEITENDFYDMELRNILNTITEMLSIWIPIVKEVLELTTEHILLQVDQKSTTEISFWKERKANLEFIYTQVDTPLVKKMVLALQNTKNAHFPNFKTLLQDIAEGLDEAREVCESLTSMSADLIELEGCSFPKLLDVIPEALIKISSSWIHSKYYKSVPSRIIVLLKKMCFILFEKTRTFLEPSSLFTESRDEVKKKVKLSLDVMHLFLKSYNDCREKFQSPKEKTKAYPWIFPDERVFTPFEIFIQRLEEILDIFLIAETYFNFPIKKLFKRQQVEYRKRLEDIQSQFIKSFNMFENCTYDPLDLNSMDFSQDYHTFSKKIKELDFKCGIIIGQICLNCCPAVDAYQIVDIFEDMIERPLVHQEFQKLIPLNISNIDLELCKVKENYNNLLQLLDRSDERFVYKNLPVFSGALQCSRDLQRKLTFPIESSQEISQYFDNKDDYDRVMKTQKENKDLLVKFEEYIISKWKLSLNSFHSKMDQELLKNHNKSHVCLNFDSQISEVAQETRYLKELLKDEFIPDEAQKFDEIAKNLLLAQSFLACSIRWYNDLTENFLEIEKKLVSKDWNKIADLIKKGYTKKWTSKDLLTYAEKLYAVTKSVYEIVNQSRRNVAAVEKSIKNWSSYPLFTREQPNSLVDFESYVTPDFLEQISAVKNTSEDMNNVLKKNRELFKCDASSDEWKNYTSYLESLIENGLKEAVKCSLEYLQQNVDSENTILVPFYEIFMSLDKDISFTPPLHPDESKSLSKLFNAVIDKIYSLAVAINRMTNNKLNYYDALYHCQELETLKASICQSVLSGCNKTISKSEAFSIYSDLWLKSIEEDLEEFVLHGPMADISSNNVEESIEEIQLESKPPTEEDFKAQIAQFDKLHRKIDDIPHMVRVESWLILNVSSFKESLLSIIKKWSSAYKNKLLELKSLGTLRTLEDEDS